MVVSGHFSTLSKQSDNFLHVSCTYPIYIDGPPHDTPEQIREDEAITARLLDVGYIVIRFHHRVDWDEIFRRHPDIFGVPAA